MKTKSDKWQVTSDQQYLSTGGKVLFARHSSLVPRHSERGIALVITLIMLSVTLIMAVAFLALSRRERSAVATTTDTAAARLAADAALAAAQAQIAANIFNTNQAGVDVGAYDYHLLVSTNYINPLGYVPAIPTSPTNVNYDYRYGGGVLNGDDLAQNIANLLYLPRVPVYVKTNSGSPLDFRFYLDLNRNGKFETNGVTTEFDINNLPIGAAFHVGDPEWIGLLERPDQPHGPNNHFVARYAFMAQPIGNALDLNFIHNQTQSSSSPNPFNVASDGYFRNEGVGSWELNLAAFLADLNTNQWNPPLGNFYNYREPGNFNQGAGFEDAQALLAYRYATYYNSLAIPSAAMYAALVNGQIDGYTIGSLMTGTALPVALNPPNQHWVGSDNTNRFFDLPSELFDPTKSSIYFTNRLAQASTNTATYDRYTFYRLLDQLGTDSTAEDARMNLNYRNITNGVVVAGLETNAYPWTPLEFFTNAANCLLTNYTASWLTANARDYVATFNTNAAFGVTHIPVLVSNQFVYSPAVNRLLQLAANIYDASTNSPYPSVFRPTFFRYPNGDLYIVGFQQVFAAAVGVPPLDNPYTVSDTTLAAIGSADANTPNANAYGVPWIIGAKKGLPNFNQFYMLNAMTVTRKLQVTRPYFGAPFAQFQTNQMYIFSLSNLLGCQLWNSYTNNYTGNLTVVARDNFSAVLTNSDPAFAPNEPRIFNYLYSTTLTTNNWIWPGTTWNASPPEVAIDNNYSTPFIIPLDTNGMLLATNSIYRYGGYSGAIPVSSPGFDPFNGDWQTNVYTPPLPQFGLLVTNRLQVFILDGNHVIDYVHFAGPETNLDLTARNNTKGLGGLADPDSSGDPAYMWSTNSYQGGATPWGVISQIAVSKGDANPASGGKWEPPPNLPGYLPAIPSAEKAFFKGMLTAGSTFSFNNKRYTNTVLAVQAPYTPTRTIYNYTAWQANDPLVHYLASDLTYSAPGITGLTYSDTQPPVPPQPSLSEVTTRYSPWGRLATNAEPNKVDSNPYNLQYKDPLLWHSDNWDFPTNKFPTPGWLGRIHRGTPWQTVYLKASDVLTNVILSGTSPVYVGTNTWAQWTGDQNFFDAVNSAPTSDRDLLDLFTTRFNDNATRGKLSINQTNLAAWSAVFSGMVALNNTGLTLNDSPLPVYGPLVTNVVISPGGANGMNSPLGQLVNGINATRASTNLFPAGVFTHLGDILRVPQLTEQSPFLNWNDAQQQQYGISDELYEWLPQQALGLLRLNSTPRYVIYCYGQALRPAANSVVTSSTGFGLCTNYQVMAESAARAVIRFDRIVFTNATGNATGTNYKATVESYNVLPPD